jgi:regulatory protein
LNNDEQHKKARSLLFRYLAYRARTGKEAAEYLNKKGFSPEVSDDMIKELQNLGYINDQKFAQDFISYRKSRDIGLHRIRFELLNKGLDKSQVDPLISAEINDHEELETIEKLISKRIPQNGCFDQRWLARQVSFLQRRGFNNHLIIKALKNYGLAE